jgi:hypothetical protein
VATGRETVVLTKDEDVEEQLHKCWRLLDTHYRGMLLADSFIANPAAYPEEQLPSGISHVDDVFLSAKLIRRSNDDLQRILPLNPRMCFANSWRSGVNGMTTLTVAVEREMERLLEIKSQHGCRNTNQLEGKNCHIWLAPLPIPMNFRDCAAIAEDRTVPANSLSIPFLDVQQAINSRGETHTFIVPKPAK